VPIHEASHEVVPQRALTLHDNFQRRRVLSNAALLNATAMCDDRSTFAWK
jgi:hypothetical protein